MAAKHFLRFAERQAVEDHHVLWIAPDGSNRMILARSRSDRQCEWRRDVERLFNQPTGQLYHVTTDNTFPYHAYAAQQDSGTIVVPNRSDYGEITYRDWFSAGGFESGYIAHDPLHPNLVYSIGWFGTVMRLDRTTGQLATVFRAARELSHGVGRRQLFMRRMIRTPCITVRNIC